jgi:hypothetical protein
MFGHHGLCAQYVVAMLIALVETARILALLNDIIQSTPFLLPIVLAKPMSCKLIWPEGLGVRYQVIAELETHYSKPRIGGDSEFQH